MNKHNFDEQSEAFLRVLPGLFRPLVHALIEQGVSAPQLTHLLKRVYIDVADKNFRVGTTRPTDSRISVMTGIHRRDIRQIRAELEDDPEEAASHISVMTSVLGHWLAHPDFTDQDGDPLPLSLLGSDKGSFAALVALTKTKLGTQAILNGLRRQGAVQIEADHVRLVDPGPNGQIDTDQRVHFFEKNVGDHIAAALANLVTGDPPFLERAVYYNDLPPASVDTIEAEARDAADQLLRRLNKAANDAQRGHDRTDSRTERFRMGVYFYREEDDTDSASAAPEGRTP